MTWGIWFPKQRLKSSLNYGGLFFKKVGAQMELVKNIYNIELENKTNPINNRKDKFLEYLFFN